MQSKDKKALRKQRDQQSDRKLIQMNPLLEEEKQEGIVRRSQRIKKKIEEQVERQKFDGVFITKGKPVDESWFEERQVIESLDAGFFTTTELKRKERETVMGRLQIHFQVNPEKIIKPDLDVFDALQYPQIDQLFPQIKRLGVTFFGLGQLAQNQSVYNILTTIFVQLQFYINEQQANFNDFIYKSLAFFLVTSQQYKDQNFLQDVSITNEEFSWLCQSSTGAGWASIINGTTDLGRTDLKKVIKENINTKDQHMKFFQMMFFYLFQDTTMSAEIYQLITKDRLNNNAPPEFLQNPEFIQFYDKDKWYENFSINDQGYFTYTVYEDIAKRLNVSKLQLIRCYHLIFQLLNTQFQFEGVDELKGIIRYLFLPRSLKDARYDKDQEALRTEVKPMLGSICHHLIIVSIYMNLMHNALYAQQYYMENLRYRVQSANIDYMNTEIQGLVQFKEKYKQLNQQFGYVTDDHFGQSAQYSSIQVASEASKFFQNIDLNESAGGLTQPRAQYQYLPNGLLYCNRNFDNDQKNVKNVCLFSRLVYELIKKQSLFGKTKCVHYIQVIISGYYKEFDEDRSELQERRYQTVNLAIKDLDKFGEFEFEDQLYAVNVQGHVRESIHEKMIYMIAEQLDFYPDGTLPPIDVSKLDFGSLQVDKFRIYTLQQGTDMDHQVIAFDEDVGQFRYFKLVKNLRGETVIQAFFKGGIVNDRDYKMSILKEFDDNDNFPCCMNIASFLWCHKNQLVHNLESRQKFLLSKEYLQIQGEIQRHNINGVFQYFKSNDYKVVLFFPQSFLLYQSDLIIDADWIFVKQGHAWIGSKEPCFTKQAQYRQEQLKKRYVYSVPNNQQNKGSRTRRTYVFYDIETLKNQENKQHMKPILLCYKTEGLFQEQKSIYGLDCCQQFINYLDNLNQRLEEHYQKEKEDDGKKREIKFKIYVYAHNGGRFDHLFLQKPIFFTHSQEYNFLGTCSNLKYAAYENIVFRDSCLLIPGKLGVLCKEFGVNQKQGFDAKNITLEQLQDEQFKKKLIEYCENDVQCLFELFFKFVNTIKKMIPGFSEGDIKQTLPSTALHIYQRFFADKKQIIYGNVNQTQGNLIQHFERLSYFGGHTQVFRHGVQKSVKYYDFVSMYVSIMSLNEYPISQGVLQWGGDAQPKERVLYIIKSFKFSEDSKITNLPVRNRKNNVSIYPLEYKFGDVGNEYLAFWGEELILAIKLGLKDIQFYQKITYEKWGQIFKHYMDTFFELKKNTKEESIAKIAKLFGNSLYGKWGQNCQNQRRLINTAEAQLIGENNLAAVLNNKQVKNSLQTQQKYKEVVIKNVQNLTQGVSEVIFETQESIYDQPGSLVRLASYTTMKGRCQIIEVIRNVGFDNIYYCDTDSVVFKNDEGIKMGVQIGKERGQIADQLPGINVLEADFIAAKCYYLKLDKPYKGDLEYVRFKGVRNSSSEQIRQLRVTGKINIPHEYWRRQWDGVGIEQTSKEITLGTKRFVNPDGSTRPFKNYDEYNIYKSKNLIYFNNNFIYE